MSKEDLLGLKFSNIPTINLRMEFNKNYAFVFSAQAEEALTPPIKAIETPMFTWGGMPEDMFTLMLQRAVLGVEAYLPASLKYAAAQLEILSKELFARLDDPFSFGAKSTAANIYHRMPAAVHHELSLKHHDHKLYEQTVKFYRGIRNPIFHGSQFTHDTNINAIRRAFDHVARLYEWIDHWHNPELDMKGFGQVAGVRKRYPLASDKKIF